MWSQAINNSGYGDKDYANRRILILLSGNDKFKRHGVRTNVCIKPASVLKYCVMLLLSLCVSIAYSQNVQNEACVYFRVNSMAVDSSFLSNAAEMHEMVTFLHNIQQDSTISIVEVLLSGSASPEGSYQYNKKLAQGRLNSLEKIIRSEADIPDSIITRSDDYISWDYLKSQVEVSNLERRDEVIAILEEQPRLVEYYNSDTHIDNRIIKLRKLDGGKVWKQMNDLFFESMRNACVVFVIYKQELPIYIAPAIIPDTAAIEPQLDDEEAEIIPDSVVIVENIIPDATNEWRRRLYIKTNAVGLGLAIANVAAEIDIAKHWSVSIPVNYSAWNYFVTTVKFRTFAINPEVRYWFSENNDDFFIGAHFGFAYYNFAFNGDYRYQDHYCETPAVGGGLSVGYRMPISKNNRWQMEFSVGAGIYPLHYDVFYNTPDYRDGLMKESIRRTFFGIDQIAVSFLYSFDIERKGGR